MTTDTLNKYDFKSVYDYIGELSKHIAEKTDGDVRIVTVVTDNTEPDSTNTAIVACGSGVRAISTLARALRFAQKKYSNDESSKLSPGAKKMLDELLDLG